jgi:hypothetical protein
MKSCCRLFVASIIVLLTGCSRGAKDYNATVRDGIQTVPHVKEILQIFNNDPTDNFITEFGFYKSQPVMWNTEVFFGGKYILTYQIPVLIDYKKSRISKAHGQAKFTLVRVSRVFNDTPDNVGADFDEDYKIGEADWERVVAANGDFKAIGIVVDTNKPVARFDDFVRAVRHDRIQSN